MPSIPCTTCRLPLCMGKGQELGGDGRPGEGHFTCCLTPGRHSDRSYQFHLGAPVNSVAENQGLFILRRWVLTKGRPLSVNPVE